MNRHTLVKDVCRNVNSAVVVVDGQSVEGIVLLERKVWLLCLVVWCLCAYMYVCIDVWLYV